MNARVGLISIAIAGGLVVSAGAWEASVSFSTGSRFGEEADGVFACSDVEDTGVFYHALRPYGSWIDLPDYGWVWRPNVGVTDRSWRPYCHNGRWRWTEYGWYWTSDYPWGWAAFHYGRWLFSATRGWVWVPDVTWGPSWVVWRSSSSHFGWAPLPPGYVYRRGSGYYHRGRPVAAGHLYGLQHDRYVFVERGRFLHRDVHTVAYYGDRGRRIYSGTSVVQYGHGRHGVGSYGLGLPRETVVAAVGQPVEVTRVSRGRPSMTLREAARGAPFGTYRGTVGTSVEPLPAARREVRTVPRSVVPARGREPAPVYTAPAAATRRSTSLKELKRAPVQEAPPRGVVASQQRVAVPQAESVVPHSGEESGAVPPRNGSGKMSLRDLKKR